MAKIKEKSKASRGGILPPKKSASAYIIFQKEVSKLLCSVPTPTTNPQSWTSKKEPVGLDKETS